MQNLVLLVLLQLLICCVTGGLAYRKGYHFLIWALAGGIIGLIVLAFLPFANRVEEEGERRRVTKRGNTTGGAIAAIGVLVAVVVVVSI